MGKSAPGRHNLACFDRFWSADLITANVGPEARRSKFAERLKPMRKPRWRWRRRSLTLRFRFGGVDCKSARFDPLRDPRPQSCLQFADLIARWRQTWNPSPPG